MNVRVQLIPALLALLALLATLPGSGEPARAQAEVTIAVDDFYFCAAQFEGAVCETEVSAGDTVVWDFSGAQATHTTTECGASCDRPTGSPLWDSGNISGGTFQHTFTDAGTFLYRCNIHPSQMRGRIVVQAPPPEPTAPAPSPVDLVAPGAVTPAPTDEAVLPRTGQGPGDGQSVGWWIAALAAGGTAAAALGVALRVKRGYARD